MFHLRLILRLGHARPVFCVGVRSRTVLGIETSCDETAAAVVDEDGRVLGEAIESQMKVHLENGGVIPHVAVHLHKENIENVVSSAVKRSGLLLEDISSIAVTTRPGLRGSLLVGVEYAKRLAEAAKKPLIPVHHMEAHALTARMVEDVQFPFLVLLASGAHCQIALVKAVDDFLLLGTSKHNSPGEVLDKIARRMKLQNLPECSKMSGGRAIEFMAQNGDPTVYGFPYSLTQYRDCDFSFSGFSSFAYSIINEEENAHNVPADGIIPAVRDLCASILHGYAVHLMHRIHRAILFCEQESLLPFDQRTLVFSGGVACNAYIRSALSQMCESLKCRFCCPAPKLCTDNGIMIAWNGIERLKANIAIPENVEDIKPNPDAPLGTDISDSVKRASIKVKVPKFNNPDKAKQDVSLAYEN